MKDKKTLFAFIFLVFLIGILIYLVMQKKNEDIGRDIRMDDLNSTIQSLSRKVTELQLIRPIDGKTPVKGVDYFDGANGQDGRDGVNGTDGKDGKDGVDGKPGTPAPELDISCVESKLMKKYSNDTFWQPTDITCEVAS